VFGSSAPPVKVVVENKALPGPKIFAAAKTIVAKRKGRSKKGQMMLLEQPGRLEVDTVIRHVYRFLGTAAAQTLTVGSALAIPGAMVTVANATYRTICSSIKVLRIQVWSPAPVAGGATASVTFAISGGSNLNAKDESFDSTVVGSASASYIDARPTKNTLVGDWWQEAASATNLLQVTCPVGTVIDLTLEATLTNTVPQLQTGLGSGAGGLGTFFYGSFDGAGVWAPIGLPTNH